MNKNENEIRDHGHGRNQIGTDCQMPILPSLRARNQQQHIQATAKMLLSASDRTDRWSGAAVKNECFITSVLKVSLPYGLDGAPFPEEGCQRVNEPVLSPLLYN